MENMIFVKQIEEICNDMKLSYIESIIFWCEKNNIELELIASLINKDQVLKSKMVGVEDRIFNKEYNDEVKVYTTLKEHAEKSA